MEEEEQEESIILRWPFAADGTLKSENYLGNKPVLYCTVLRISTLLYLAMTYYKIMSKYQNI